MKCHAIYNVQKLRFHSTTTSRITLLVYSVTEKYFAIWLAESSDIKVFQFIHIYMKVFQIIAQNKSIICTSYFGMKTTRDSETVKKLFRAGIFFLSQIDVL